MTWFSRREKRRVSQGVRLDNHSPVADRLRRDGSWLMDTGHVVYRDSLELWLIRDKLVASQRCYSFPYMNRTFRENRYFYCPKCGEVWGKRIDVGSDKPRHFYLKEECQPCGGTEDMRYPWELSYPDVHSSSVLAHLLMLYTNDLGDRNEESKIATIGS